MGRAREILPGGVSRQDWKLLFWGYSSLTLRTQKDHSVCKPCNEADQGAFRPEVRGLEALDLVKFLEMSLLVLLVLFTLL
jgi:hypothetical protein